MRRSHLFVYYRVLPEHELELSRRLQMLALELPVVPRLMRRPETDGQGRLTWMEMYLGCPAGFEATLEDAVARHALGGLIDGPRRLERFVDF